MDRNGRRSFAGPVGTLALLLTSAGCLRPGPAVEQPYRVPTPGWSQPAPGAQGQGEAAPASVTAGKTLLEELKETQERLVAAEAEVERLRADHTELSQAISQLGEDNRALEQLLTTVQEERDGAREELDAQGGRLTEMEMLYRTLADELLLERIARVRTERELVQARIDGAETYQDG